MSKAADLIELFSSVQGEGVFVGRRQAFLRFFGCNLTCVYCDTESLHPPEFCLIEGAPGRRDFIPVPNPVALERVIKTIEGWQLGWPGIHHSISLTGGEPLLCSDILAEWLPPLRKLLPIYLETNGTLHTALETVIRHIDYISMDIKLPSATGTHELWECHRQFLEVAKEKTLFVKIVIGPQTEDWEIVRGCETIAAADDRVTLILQPETDPDGKIAITPIRTLELQELATRYLSDVRVIPQTHKFMGQL